VRTPSALAIRWCGGPPRADSGGAQRRRTPRQRGRRPQDQWHCAERHRVQGRHAKEDHALDAGTQRLWIPAVATWGSVALMITTAGATGTWLMHGPASVAAYPGTIFVLVAVLTWLQQARTRRDSHAKHPELSTFSISTSKGTTLVERVLHDQKCTCALFRCVSDDSDRCGGASRQSVCDRTPRQRRRILWDLVTDTMRWWLTMRAGVECRRLSRMRHSEFACSRILEIYCFPEYWFLAQSRLSGQPSSKPV